MDQQTLRFFYLWKDKPPRPSDSLRTSLEIRARVRKVVAELRILRQRARAIGDGLSPGGREADRRSN